MGTIIARKRRDGSTGYMAQIVLKRKGAIVHREAQTFDRKQAAKAWLARRETELAEPRALERPEDPTLAAVIDRYIEESKRKIGRTKAQVLRTIKDYDIANMRCSKITSVDLIAFARALPVQPQTVQNYLSHLSAVFAVARPAWGYPLDQQAIKDTFVVTKRMGLTSKSRARQRRPTIDELDRLMEHFAVVQQRRPGSVPMQKIIVFALFSTRRQEEITRIEWRDYEKAHDTLVTDRVLVRDMKHPGDKHGNDQYCELPPEAFAIIETMPRIDARIFPYSTDAISAAFTRACQVLGIEDLHFHDLRHEGISRLFEMGRTIPQAAAVSGHRSWQSLKRYSHLNHVGDRWANWKWKEPGALHPAMAAKVASAPSASTMM
jgi:integrase